MSGLKSVYESTVTWAEQRQIHLTHALEQTSTNDIAKGEALQENSDIKLYVTGHQSKGRGRGQNTWTDTGAGDCLLSSWSFRLNGSPQTITGPCLGLALYKAVQRIWPARNWSVKAPNDLYLDGKKVAGILAETVSAGAKTRLIVGLGFNVLNHPRAIENCTHVDAEVDGSDWFRFLDELLLQFKSASTECQNPQLSPKQCQDLVQALNANPSKAFTTSQVTAAGDIVHSSGRIRWTDL